MNIPRRKTLPLAAAATFAFMAAASASTYLGPVNDAECYTPEVLNEELDLGYGQKPSGEMREHAGPWQSVMMYRNRDDQTWALIGKPYESDARRITKVDRLLCIIDGGEGDDYRDNPSYRSLMGDGAPALPPP